MPYTTLIDTATAADHLSDPDWVIVDCRFDPMEPELGPIAYNAIHIAGAVYAHMEEDLASAVSEKSGRHPLPDPQALAKKLGQWGIGNDTQVVVYDDSSGAAAGRLWLLLRWLGHDKVALLDGGLQAWHREKRPMDRERPSRPVKTFVPKLRPELVVDTAFVEKALTSGEQILVDARVAERFKGEVEPLDPVAGHIPGSVNMPTRRHLDNKGYFLPAEQLRALYLPLIGERQDAGNLVTLCGSGVTACHHLIALEVAGFSGARLYAGSWSEWIRDPNHPVATGE